MVAKKPKENLIGYKPGSRSADMALITIDSFSFIKGRLNRLRRQEKKKIEKEKEKEEDKARVEKLI